MPVDGKTVDVDDVDGSLHGEPRGGDKGSVSRGGDVDVDEVAVDQIEVSDDEVVGREVTALERVRALVVVHGMPFSDKERVEVGEVKEGKGRVVDRDELEETEAAMLCKRAGTY